MPHSNSLGTEMNVRKKKVARHKPQTLLLLSVELAGLYHPVTPLRAEIMHRPRAAELISIST